VGQPGASDPIPSGIKAACSCKWNQGWLVNPVGTPKQLNDVDCGIFALLAASYVAADKQFDYNQCDVSNFFRAMCCIECHRMELRSTEF
jgi:hypothetical protein